jgi:hypothetical protein
MATSNDHTVVSLVKGRSAPERSHPGRLYCGGPATITLPATLADCCWRRLSSQSAKDWIVVPSTLSASPERPRPACSRSPTDVSVNRPQGHQAVAVRRRRTPFRRVWSTPRSMAAAGSCAHQSTIGRRDAARLAQAMLGKAIRRPRLQNARAPDCAAPHAARRVSRASPRAVLTRSPVRFGIGDGASTRHRRPSLAR